MKKKPQFSIIITTCNREDFLVQSIRSVQNQTYVDFECLIVDDANSNVVKKIIDELKDSRFTYYQNVRSKGANGARNTGIGHSKGKWIAFLDDDDLWLSNKLEHHKIAHAKLEKPCLIYSGVINYLGL